MPLRNKKVLFFFFILLVFSSLLFNIAQAYVIGSSDMDLYNLTFSSSDPLAELFWSDTWYAEVIAHAQDTCSGSMDDYKDLLSNNGTISAIASTAHVYSQADYIVNNGDMLTIDSDAYIEASTHSDIYIPNAHVAQGDGHAIANFDNYFIVTGGISGDPVDVTFTLDYAGQLTGDADELGYFSIALAALFKLEDDFGNLLAEDYIHKIRSGPPPFQKNYTGKLTLSTTLLYDNEYWLYAEADSEVYGTNAPEPSALLLMLSGIPIFIKKSNWGKVIKKS